MSAGQESNARRYEDAPGIRRSRVKPLAVVGSQDAFEEEMFGAAFDGVVMRRFWAFIRAYKRLLAIAIAGVLLFTASQIALPLLIRFAIDSALVEGSAALLRTFALAFLAVVVVNYLSNMAQEFIVGRVAGHLLFDLRRAMYARLQHVSLSFMDKT